MEELKVRAEVANVAKSEDNFKHLIADEEFFFDASVKNAASESYEQVTLMVSMEGTGIGIPFLAKDRIFMPFVQADNSTSQHYGGTGIGLSFSKCLVKLISGEISFISQLQVGSTFSFTVDFGTIDKNAITDMKKHNLEDLPPNFRWLKAIVVDGKPIRASVTGYHLKRLGIQAKVANIMNKVLQEQYDTESIAQHGVELFSEVKEETKGHVSHVGSGIVHITIKVVRVKLNKEEFRYDDGFNYNKESDFDASLSK
ncbi:hypothetical protein JHK87_018619 [Glycine soja]|nr:hypothetical protein JHK87_018619 [Glycine soja]